MANATFTLQFDTEAALAWARGYKLALGAAARRLFPDCCLRYGIRRRITVHHG